MSFGGGGGGVEGCGALCVVPQLRVVRAFKSTLEDLEDKRSTHSFHSLRSSRSRLSPHSLAEDAGAHHPFLHPHQPCCLSPGGGHIQVKSQSFENVPLVSRKSTPVLYSTNRQAFPPKTLSHSDIAGQRSPPTAM
ncbi:uncharacterized protein LOC143284944 [Babylonia areolata]|uniref:uncharacterized protein LOC143284944 n=1 Tax=Babylonia areolata TaxID=304850 RepID=UPI003FCF0EC5